MHLSLGMLLTFFNVFAPYIKELIVYKQRKLKTKSIDWLQDQIDSDSSPKSINK